MSAFYWYFAIGAVKAYFLDQISVRQIKSDTWHMGAARMLMFAVWIVAWVPLELQYEYRKLQCLKLKD